MFGIFKRKSPKRHVKITKYMLTELGSELLYGYFDSHDTVIEKKIMLEIRSGRRFKVSEVYA